MDLDQAMCLERNADGYRVYYAIADVAAFVSAGDPVDIEANRRGETLYGANSRIPLHPTVLSEGAASLLPNQLRPALLWMIDLDKTGEIAAIDVRRARVKSRARLDYAGVQQGINGGTADPIWGVLQEIGELRQQLERARGGLTLNLPDQEIGCSGGRWDISYRVNQPVEDWNAQISLLTGIAAARLMVEAKVGLLRTMPDPDPQAITRLRLTAKALGLAWPDGQPYFRISSALPRSIHRQASYDVDRMHASMLRGAGYTAFNGSLPAQPQQSAIAAEYAHATAPLRRLGDRYVGEVCVALCAKEPVPEWAIAALPVLPATMQVADRRAHQYERAVIELIEAAILAPRVGENFQGTIIEVAERRPSRLDCGRGDAARPGDRSARDFKFAAGVGRGCASAVDRCRSCHAFGAIRVRRSIVHLWINFNPFSLPSNISNGAGCRRAPGEENPFLLPPGGGDPLGSDEGKVSTIESLPHPPDGHLLPGGEGTTLTYGDGNSSARHPRRSPPPDRDCAGKLRPAWCSPMPLRGPC